MVKPYLNQVGGKVDSDISLFTGGMNTYVDKAFLESNQMPYVINMTMYRPPMMCTRARRETIATKIDNPIDMNMSDVVEMWSRDDKDIYYVVNISGDLYLKRLLYDEDTGKFEIIPIGQLPATTNQIYFCYVPLGSDRYVYIGNEDFKCRYEASDLNPLDPGAFITYTDDHYGIPVWHKAKLWLCRPTQNTIEWSESRQPDSFVVDPDTGHFAGEVYVTNHKGDLQTIISFDDKLMVLCEHSIHAIYGESGDPSNQNFFQLVDIMNNLGIHSPKCLAVGGGRMFWLGDDYEVYEYTGSYINMISRPDGDERHGGIGNLFTADEDIDRNQTARMIATSSRLFLDMPAHLTTMNKYMFVYDIYNKIWWCEDGEFIAIANYSDSTNQIIMALPNGDIQVAREKYTVEGTDIFYNFETGETEEKEIEYEFHTRVYGADGVDLRKSITEVIFQARATADVYINDIWTSFDKWEQAYGYDSSNQPIDVNYRKIGSLIDRQQTIQEQTTKEVYRPETYEQQHLYTEKMYGQRLNAFQIIVKGKGKSEFYLMKREWRAR